MAEYTINIPVNYGLDEKGRLIPIAPDEVADKAFVEDVDTDITVEVGDPDDWEIIAAKALGDQADFAASEDLLKEWADLLAQYYSEDIATELEDEGAFEDDDESDDDEPEDEEDGEEAA